MKHERPDENAPVDEEEVDAMPTIELVEHERTWKLSELSHKEISWKNARAGLHEGENGNRKLKLEDI